MCIPNEMARNSEWHNGRFQELCATLLQSDDKQDCITFSDVSSWIEKLLEVEFLFVKCEQQVVSGVLKKCSELVNTKDIETVDKYIALVYQLLCKPKLVLSDGLQQVLNSLLRCLHTCPPSMHDHIWRAIGAVLYMNGPRLPQEQASELLRKLRQMVNTSDEMLRTLVQCVHNMCMRSEVGQEMSVDLQVHCHNLLMSVLNSSLLQMPPYHTAKIWRSCLLGIEELLRCRQAVPSKDMGALLTVLQVYFSYGLDVAQLSQDVRRLSVSSEEQQDDIEQQYKETSDEPGSSSELSDAEWPGSFRATPQHRLFIVQMLVRCEALACFQALIKAVDRKTMFSYWPVLVPESTMSVSRKALFTAVARDPAFKVRKSAIIVLTNLLEGSRQYLLAAEDSERSRLAPFPPFSLTLASMIKELHRCFLVALVVEHQASIIIQILKGLTMLVSCVPYHRLKPGLLSRVVKQVKPFLVHKDPNVRVACLSCFGAVVSVQSPLLEVCHILIQHSQTVQAAGGDSGVQSDIPTPQLSSGAQTPSLSEQLSNTTSPCWILNICVHIIDSELLRKNHLDSSETSTAGVIQPLPVKLEALQLLSSLAKHYYPVLKNYISLLSDIIQLCLDDFDNAMKLHGAKLLESLTAAITDDEQADPHILVEVLWQPLLAKHVSPLLTQSEEAPLRICLCDSIANMGSAAFYNLNKADQVLVLTVCLGLASDHHFGVEAAALRTVGVLVLYPCLKQDSGFLCDAASVVTVGCEHTEPLVQIRAAWSLGNICDVLVCNRESGEDEVFPDRLLVTLFYTAIHTCKSSDKVRANGLRALGNLLRYLPPSALDSGLLTKDSISKAVQVLCGNTSSGPAKVRWNACYALANMLRNNSLLASADSWMTQVLDCLTQALEKCKTFKVKIASSLALSIPSQRAHYGSSSSIMKVWLALQSALQAAHQTTELSDFKLKDSLNTQVVNTIVHLCAILKVKDIMAFAPFFVQSQAVLNSAAALYTANAHTCVDLAVAINNMSSGADQVGENIISFLQALQQGQPTSNLEQAHAPVVTSFRQTYD